MRLEFSASLLTDGRDIIIRITPVRPHGDERAKPPQQDAQQRHAPPDTHIILSCNLVDIPRLNRIRQQKSPSEGAIRQDCVSGGHGHTVQRTRSAENIIGGQLRSASSALPAVAVSLKTLKPFNDDHNGNSNNYCDDDIKPSRRASKL